ncbi:hypothetical protein RIF29_25021 [Crotalaria pallida]|uniref:Uncharacterized protein n=1 Tax=Crotalaria pallida TaxID=3830 RepID=A0AAN9ELN0_CROPI
MVIHWPNAVRTTGQSFKFLNHLTLDDEFIQIVNQNWSRRREGCAMFRIMRNLDQLKAGLKDLNQRKFKSIDVKEAQAREKLDYIQNLLQSDPMNNHLLKLEKEAREEHLKVNRHLFFECSWSKQLLQLAANWVGVDVMHFKFQNWLRWLRYGFKEKWRRQVVTAMVAACAYGVWSERNNQIFRQQQLQPHQTFRLLQAELGTKLVFSKWAKASGPNNFLIDRIRAAI